MSATQQTQVNALVRAQLQLLLDEIHQLKQECKLLAETRDAYANNHNERLKKLEANAAAATRPSPSSTRRLSTAMENTIRRSSREQLADLVIGLCNRDDATQNAAVSLLLDGEGDAQMSTSSTSINTLLPSDPPPSKRRASRAFSTTTKTCKNCKEKYNPDNMRRSEDDECWYHPGKFKKKKTPSICSFTHPTSHRCSAGPFLF